MIDLTTESGIIAAAFAVIGFLARLLWEQQRRKPDAAGTESPARRCDVAELHELHVDVRSVLASVNDLGVKLATLDSRVATLERRVRTPYAP